MASRGGCSISDLILLLIPFLLYLANHSFLYDIIFNIVALHFGLRFFF